MTDPGIAQVHAELLRERLQLFREAKPAFWDLKDTADGDVHTWMRWGDSEVLIEVFCACGYLGAATGFISSAIIECPSCGRQYELGDWVSLRPVPDRKRSEYATVIDADDGVVSRTERNNLASYAEKILRHTASLSPTSRAALEEMAAGEADTMSKQHAVRIEERAYQGARFINRRTEGWRNCINPDLLDMHDPDRSVLGQVYGSFRAGLHELNLDGDLAEHLGYTSDARSPLTGNPDDDRRRWELAVLEAEWRMIIIQVGKGIRHLGVRGDDGYYDRP
jgi:hypothetical protein